jgi:Ni,Fe-hydrogenase maturation factor
MNPRVQERTAVSDECLPILVAAYGNDLAADDAFGPLVAEAVRARSLAGVAVANLGMKPASLLDHLPGRRAVCVVDAARCDGLPAGTLIEADGLPFSRRACPPCGRTAAAQGGQARRLNSKCCIGHVKTDNELSSLRLVHDAALSTHGLALADELGLAERLGICPKEVWLVAVIADSVEVGRPVGDAVLRQVPVAASRIADWASRLLESA